MAALMGSFKYGTQLFGTVQGTVAQGAALENPTGIETVTGLNMDGEVATYGGGAEFEDSNGKMKNSTEQYNFGNSLVVEDPLALTSQEGGPLPASIGQLGKDKFGSVAMGNVSMAGTDVTTKTLTKAQPTTIPMAGARFSR